MMRDDEEKKKDEKMREGREWERYTPLGTIAPGLEEESLQDPSFLHAGWREEAIYWPPGVLWEVKLPRTM